MWGRERSAPSAGADRPCARNNSYYNNKKNDDDNKSYNTNSYNNNNNSCNHMYNNKYTISK